MLMFYKICMRLDIQLPSLKTNSHLTKDLHSVGQLILFQLASLHFDEGNFTNYDNTYACICQQLCGFIK